MKRFLTYVGVNEKLQQFVEENKDMIFKVAIAGLLVIAAFFVFTLNDKEKEVQVEEPSEASADTTQKKEAAGSIYVDIGGEVNSPMVAQLPEGSRVEDAITAAGGITEKADLTEINRAAFVEDGEKILIPSILPDPAEAGTLTGSTTEQFYYSDGKININTADSQQLQELNGVGPATAEKIIDYREENGSFAAIDELKNVSGIGDKTFEKLKDDIKV